MNDAPALLAAQTRLEALRRQFQAVRSETVHPKQVETATPALPDHLGWDSPAITALWRRRQPLTPASTFASPLPASQPSAPIAPPPTSAETLTLHPDLALAWLRQQQAAPGRVWLLLRQLDQRGCGWVTVAEARRRLTHKQEPWRICGWRQLRNLLRQGDGLFWQRDHERIWLRGAARVAYALGLERLTGQPVALPLSILLSSIGAVRAHLYASFHSGRAASQTPIARQTLTNLSGVGSSTQRLYEQRCGLRPRPTVALGPRWETTAAQQLGWERGRSLFSYQDRAGRYGPAGVRYLAWRLPNRYAAAHPGLSVGRRKRLNRKLAGLLPSGTTGNGRRTLSRCFYQHGAAAAEGLTRQTTTRVYWPAPDQRLWYMLEHPSRHNADAAPPGKKLQG